MAGISFHSTYLERRKKYLLPLLKNKKTVSYFTLTLSLFTLSFFGLFAVRPALITASSLIKNVNDLNKLKADYENKISSIIRAQSEYEQVRNDLPLVDSALPQNANFTSLTKIFEKFAKLSDVEIQLIQIDKAPISKQQPQAKPQYFTFNLIALGKYENLYSYLNHIVNWKRIVNIKNVDLAEEKSTDSADLRLMIRGITFYEP